MSLQSVEDELGKRAPDIKIIKLDESGATVDEAAATLGIEPGSVAKTLSLHLGEDVILLVMRGDARIDNKKYKKTFGAKAKMLSFEEVEPLTGHPVGGMCPFGLKGSPSVYLDESIRHNEFVYPAAGDRFHAFKIAVKRLEELTGSKWVDVCGER